MAETILDHTLSGALHSLASDEVSYLELGLRGVCLVRVRFLGRSGEIENDVMALLGSRGIQATLERLEGMVPLPRRRFSFRYEPTGAVLTVFADGDLHG